MRGIVAKVIERFVHIAFHAVFGLCHRCLLLPLGSFRRVGLRRRRAHQAEPATLTHDLFRSLQDPNHLVELA
jgi:hypothetical protein